MYTVEIYLFMYTVNSYMKNSLDKIAIVIECANCLSSMLDVHS